MIETVKRMKDRRESGKQVYDSQALEALLASKKETSSNTTDTILKKQTGYKKACERRTKN